MEELEEVKRDIKDINKALYTLIEAQSNTTHNVDMLSSDVKEMLKASMSCDIVNSDVKDIEKRVSILEDSKTWGFRLVIGAVILAVVGLVAGGIK